jgi:antitoxin component YwqK of YwqJK toxin-antitoxin module
MKKTIVLSMLLTAVLIQACNLIGSKGDDSANEGDTLVQEVRKKFTGVKPNYLDGKLVSEITYRDGIRHGLTKTYYASGVIKQIIPYCSGLKCDTARWFYEDGKLFRNTPYLNDMIHGTQVQFYRNGRVKASMSYEMGIRKNDLQEYYENGKPVTTERRILIQTRDEYQENGVYKIFAELDNKSAKVTFYKGEMTNGLFDPLKVEKITTSGGTGFTELSRRNGGNPGYITIIAEYTTSFGNKDYYTIRVSVPYRDIK